MTPSISSRRCFFALLCLLLLLGAAPGRAATYTWVTSASGTGNWDASLTDTTRWGAAQNGLWGAVNGGTNTAVFTTSGATTNTGTVSGIVYLNQLTGTTDNGSGKNVITGGTLSFAGTNPKIYSASTAGGGLQIDSTVQSSGNLRVDLWQGAVRLNANNSSTLSGTITLTGSTGGSYQNLISLDVGHNNALGTATIVVEPNFSTASTNNNVGYVKLSVTTVTVGNNFVLSGTGGSNGYGQINMGGNSTTTGTVSLNGNALISIGANSTGNMSGVIADGTVAGRSLTFASVGNASTNYGTLNLGGTNTFTGDLNVGASITVKLTSGRALQNQNTVNFVTAARRSTGPAVLQLNGNSTTVGLLSSTHGLYSALVENASSATAATLTVGNSSALSGTFIGTFRDGGTKALTLAKAGGGTLVLAGTSGHTGGTQINGGTLKLDFGVAATGTQTTLDGFLPTGGDVTIADGGTLSVAGRANGTATGLTSGAYDFRDQDVYLNSTINLITVASTTGLAPGMLVSGNGIAAGTYITTILSGSQFRISAVGTSGTYTGQTLTVTPANFTTAQTLGSMTLSSGTGTVEVVNRGLGTTLTVTGTVGGNGGLRKTGDGVLVLGGSSSYSGLTAIDAGTLSISSTNGLAGTSGVNIAGGASLKYTGGADTFSKNITASSGTATVNNSGAATLTLSGTLTKNGTVLQLTGGSFNVTGKITGTSSKSDLYVNGGTVTLSNASNDYNGPTVVFGGGTLKNGVDNAIPSTSSELVLGDASTGGTYDLNGFNQTLTKLSDVGNASRIVTNAAAGSGTSTLTITGESAFGGVIQNGATAKMALTKSGSGTFTLTGNSSYTGATTVNGGKLLVSGSLSGTTNVSVGTGAELTVNGLVNAASTTSVVSGSVSGTGSLGALNVQEGGTVSPGNSGVGVLKADSASFANGSIIRLELNKSGTQGGVAGINWDQLQLTNGLDLSAAGEKGIKLQLAQVAATGWSWDASINHTWSGFLTFTGSTGLALSKFDIDYSAFSGSGTWSVAENGNQLDLQYLAIPEPNSFAMLLGGFGMLLFTQRIRGRRFK